ncbi:hypothetical protein QE412_000798 [Microbacterium trichothecenolyticum]|uniref:Uncharacterized protein n=1 Tax=Microbacterium trichothecenolyticum TaxID=69370 RepID=A0ABU0TRD9_MICTR|nr:hypothetical protein [Microbacterium trichothecenolyticum]
MKKYPTLASHENGGVTRRFPRNLKPSESCMRKTAPNAACPRNASPPRKNQAALLTSLSVRSNCFKSSHCQGCASGNTPRVFLRRVTHVVQNAQSPSYTSIAWCCVMPLIVAAAPPSRLVTIIRTQMRGFESCCAFNCQTSGSRPPTRKCSLRIFATQRRPGLRGRARAPAVNTQKRVRSATAIAARRMLSPAAASDDPYPPLCGECRVIRIPLCAATMDIGQLYRG